MTQVQGFVINYVSVCMLVLIGLSIIRGWNKGFIVGLLDRQPGSGIAMLSFPGTVDSSPYQLVARSLDSAQRFSADYLYGQSSTAPG